jgi:cyclopropane-fatty-acyl-phospholipid synthase
LHNLTVCLEAYVAGALTLYRLVIERKGPVAGLGSVPKG